MVSRPQRLKASAIVFDLDGVLVDPYKHLDPLWKNYVARWWKNPERIMPVVVAAWPNRAVREVMNMIAPEWVTEEEVRQTIQEFNDEALELAELTEPVEDAYQLLQRIPSDRWGIISEAKPQLARARLTAAGLPIPDVVVTLQELPDVTSDITKELTEDEVERLVGTEEAAAFLSAANHLKVPKVKNCLAVTDTPVGIRGAKLAGLRVAGVPKTMSEEFLRREKPDLIIARIDDLNIDFHNDHLDIKQSDTGIGWDLIR